MENVLAEAEGISIIIYVFEFVREQNSIIMKWTNKKELPKKKKKLKIFRCTSLFRWRGFTKLLHLRKKILSIFQRLGNVQAYFIDIETKITKKHIACSVAKESLVCYNTPHIIYNI